MSDSSDPPTDAAADAVGSAVEPLDPVVTVDPVATVEGVAALKTPRLRWMLGVFAVAGLILHLAVQQVHLPVSLRDKLAGLRPTAGEDVVILGTCLASQELNAERIAEAWQGGSVYTLGTEGTGPMDWALGVRNVLPAGVEHVVIAFVSGDLQNALPPYESRTPELMRARDLPEVWETCPQDRDAQTHCRIGLGLLWAWAPYRYRGFVSANIWKWWGAVNPAEQTTIGGLRAIRGQQASYKPTPKQALVWLGRLADATHAYGATLTLVQMPVRSDSGGTAALGDRDFPGLATVLAGRGAGFSPLPAMPAALFEDDRHVRAEGADLLSASLGEWLKKGEFEPY